MPEFTEEHKNLIEETNKLVIELREKSEEAEEGKLTQAEFKEAQEGKSQFVTNLVDANLAETLQAKDVVFSSKPESTFLPTLLSWLVPISIFFLIWMFLMRRMAGRLGGPGGGLMSVGKSKAKVYVEADTGVSFDDVAGVDEARKSSRRW